MKKRVVVALGHRALGTTLPEQKEAVKKTAKVIGDLIEKGYQVAITHSNAPQVGMIHTAMNEFAKEHEDYTAAPMSVCSAMSQGYIGYDLQNALKEELLNRGLQQGVATVLTQVVVDENDPAFRHPTKPIGAFMTKEEADKMVAERGYNVIEDAGRGYRRVVASPKPQSIIEIESIRDMVDAGLVVVACGGGGIPVYKTEGHHLKGAAAVIDKDFAGLATPDDAVNLAFKLPGQVLDVPVAQGESVKKGALLAINFGKPNQTWLDSLTPAEAKVYMERGHFAPGSMLPKVQAASTFAESKPGRTALITLLEKARDGLAGKTGTTFTGDAE